jgi:hypothetical protein
MLTGKGVAGGPLTTLHLPVEGLAIFGGALGWLPGWLRATGPVPSGIPGFKSFSEDFFFFYR